MPDLYTLVTHITTETAQSYFDHISLLESIYLLFEIVLEAFTPCGLDFILGADFIFHTVMQEYWRIFSLTPL